MKWALTIGVLGLAAAGTVAGGQYYVSQRLVDSVQKELAAKTGLKPDIAETHVSLWPKLHYSATGVKLTGDELLQEPTLAADELSFDVAWDSILAGTPKIENLVLAQPRLNLIEDESRPPRRTETASNEQFKLDTLTIKNGSITVQNRARGASARADALNMKISHTPEDALAVSGKGRFGTYQIQFENRLLSLADFTSQKPTSLRGEIELGDMSGTLSAPLSFQAKVRRDEHTLTFEPDLNSLSTGAMKVSGKVDWSSAVPFLNVSIAGDNLEFGSNSPFDNASSEWKESLDLSTRAWNMNALKLIDTAIEANFTQFRAGPVKMSGVSAKAGLSNGLFKVALQSTSLYKGALRASLTIDAAQKPARESLDLKLEKIDAKTFLADVANQNHVEGRIDMTVALQSSGAAPQDMANSLTGTTKLHFQDGAITNIDAPSSIHAIAAYLPPSWKSLTDRIDITALDASFDVTNGIATTNDIHVVSPIIDVHGKGGLDLSQQTYDLRFEPKLVTHSQGKPASPLDLGAALIVRGPWANPQLSTDLSGLLNDPQGALEKLGTLGQEFFGNGGGGIKIDPKNPNNEEIIKGVGDLLEGFLGGRQDQGQRRPRSYNR